MTDTRERELTPEELRKIEIETEQLEQQPDVAQYEVNYVPEKYRATVDPETQEKIKRARQLQELLTRMATIRQAQQRP